MSSTKKDPTLDEFLDEVEQEEPETDGYGRPAGEDWWDRNTPSRAAGVQALFQLATATSNNVGPEHRVEAAERLLTLSMLIGSPVGSYQIQEALRVLREHAVPAGQVRNPRLAIRAAEALVHWGFLDESGTDAAD